MAIALNDRSGSRSWPVSGHGSTYRSRYECKYLVDAAAVPGIRRFLRQFAQPDKHAAGCPGYRYAVNSLYLDSPDLALYAQTAAGETARFKLRVRTYSDDPDSPAFFEVKTKINNVVSKRRAGLSREHAQAMLERGSMDFLDTLPSKTRDDLMFFRHHVRTTGARPVARVKYMREAYEAHGNEPVRVTFDTDLMHAATRDGCLSHGEGPWVSTPTRGVVLEIKFTDRLPGWAQELVHSFRLGKQGVPKYVLSVDHMLRRSRSLPAPAVRAIGSSRRI